MIQKQHLQGHEYDLSLMLAQLTQAVWDHCYENAYPTFFAFPELFEPNGLFVEGWIVFEYTNNRVVVMEHGWLFSGESLIDPTIVLAVEKHQSVFYYPGVFREKSELVTLENALFPQVRISNFGEDGMKHSGYRAAYEAATQKARSLLTEGKAYVEVKATFLASQDEGERGVEPTSPLHIFERPSEGKTSGQEHE